VEAAGKDVNAVDMDRQSALMVAAVKGCSDIVNALIAAGADVNQRDVHGVTALMVAATSGHLPILEALLNAKADFTARGANGFTAFEMATRNKHHEITQILKIHRIIKLLEDGVPVASLGSANLELKDTHGRTVLLVAAYMGKVRAVEALIFGGANLDYADADG
jgi:ankyrin repeat protein